MLIKQADKNSVKNEDFNITLDQLDQIDMYRYYIQELQNTYSLQLCIDQNKNIL